MTLDTRIYVLDEVPIADLFRQCQALLTPHDVDRREPDQQRSEDGQDKTWANGTSGVLGHEPWTICNDCGQGLPALLMVHYRPGAPLRSDVQAAEHDEDICNVPQSDHYDPEEPVCDGARHRVACWAEVSYDTSYGYTGLAGEGCGDLHALLVGELGKWLDERGLRWSWRNEFTGEVHTGYESLTALMTGGFEAAAWFRTSVLPAILAGEDAR